MTSLAASLGKRFPLRPTEPLAGWTTLRIGGPAEWFFEPARPEDFADLLDALDAGEVPWRILGGGANTLAPDGGVPGAVLHTGAMRRIFREENCLRVWPGATLPALVTAAWKAGLSGLERLVGVPGNAGGALAMNAGSGDWGIWQEVQELTVRAPDGKRLLRTPDEVQPSYRMGNLGRSVVLEALLQLEPDDPAVIHERMSEFLERKNASQPVRLSSAGCAFKNPPGDSAGRLIDAAGLKGAVEGSARISEMHANFIVNEGGATAAQVRALLERAESAVEQDSGVRLQRELVVWPEPLEPVLPDDSGSAKRPENVQDRFQIEG